MFNDPRAEGGAPAIAGAVFAGLIRGAVQSALVLGPGFVLLSLGARLLGLTWLTVGSVVVFVWHFRRPWPVTAATCLIPVVGAGLSFLTQFAGFATLFDGFTRTDVGSTLVFVAIVAGGVLGYLNGRTHDMFVENGQVKARRTVAYLGFWGLCSLGTHAFGASQDVLGTVAGILAGFFSTSAITTLSWQLWRRRGLTLRAAAAPAVSILAAALTAPLLIWVLLQGVVVQTEAAQGRPNPNDINISGRQPEDTGPPFWERCRTSPESCFGARGPDDATLAAAMTTLVLVLCGVGSSVANKVAESVEESVKHVETDVERHAPIRLVAPEEPPPLINPYGGKPLARNAEGQYLHPTEHRWINREEAELLIANFNAEIERRREDSRRFQEETEQRRAELRARGQAADEAELEKRNRDASLRKRMLQQWERIEQVALQRNDAQILLRSGDDRVLRADGSLDMDYLLQLNETLRNRVIADMIVQDDRGYSGTVNEWATMTGEAAYEGGWDTVVTAAGAVDSISNSFLVRLGAGYLSGGSSEVFFQSWGAGRAMRQAAEKAADRGQAFSRVEGFGAGMVDFAKQNLPIATAEALGRMRINAVMKRYGKAEGPDVGWAEVGLAAAGDFMAATGLMSDARNVVGGLGKAGRTIVKGPQTRGRTRLQQLARDVRFDASGNPFAAMARELEPEYYRALSTWFEQASAPQRKALADQLDKLTGWLARDPLPPYERMTPAEAGSAFKATAISDKTAELAATTRRLADPGTPVTAETLNRALRELDNARTARASPSRIRLLELRAERQAFEYGRQQGQAKVNRLEQTLRDLDGARAAGATPARIRELEEQALKDVIRVQTDKHAMNKMNELPRVLDGPAKGTNPTIQRFNQIMEDAYARTDLRARETLAKELKVRPEDIEVVKITNLEGESEVPVDPAPPPRETPGLASTKKVNEGGVIERADSGWGHGRVIDAGENAGVWRSQPEVSTSQAKGDKVSFDRDLTMRLRTVDASANVVWKDIPSNTMGRHYNEAFFEVMTGRTAQSSGTGFERVHLTGEEHLMDPLLLTDPDKFAKVMDQATTDRLHPEAYGTGQGDLDTATKDAFRGRDLTDAEVVAKTIEFKVHHWLQEADHLRAEARRPGIPPEERRRLLAAVAAHQEEGMRQLTKQYNNMVVTRTEKMIGLNNAPGATIPRNLAEKIHVLKGVQEGRYTAPEADAILKQMGTNTEQVAGQMSAYVESLQKARNRRPLWHPAKLKPISIRRSPAGSQERDDAGT